MLPLAQARLTAPAVAGRGLNEWLGIFGEQQVCKVFCLAEAPEGKANKQESWHEVRVASGDCDCTSAYCHLPERPFARRWHLLGLQNFVAAPCNCRRE